jgi:condensin-2 complex subunit D3
METTGQHETASVTGTFSMIQVDELSREEEEEEEEIYFSGRDLCQIRDAIFNLLKNFLRLLPKFSLKEKPQSIQTCIEVSENS